VVFHNINVWWKHQNATTVFSNVAYTFFIKNFLFDFDFFLKLTQLNEDILVLSINCFNVYLLLVNSIIVRVNFDKRKWIKEDDSYILIFSIYLLLNLKEQFLIFIELIGIIYLLSKLLSLSD